ncbi:MAG: dTMP kinase [Elusimicrobiota bacterium]
MAKGYFITIEGIDGCGKSTQAKLLADYCLSKEQEVVLTREPGGDNVSEKIRRIILDPENKVDPLAELFLYEASRAQHYKEVVEPALNIGKTVISERSFDSTVVYQGYGRGIDKKIINELNSIAMRGAVPTITIVLDIDPEVSFKRIDETEFKGMDRIEKEGLEFQKKLRAGYKELVKQNKDRMVLVEVTNKSINEAHKDIIKIVADR